MKPFRLEGIFVLAFLLGALGCAAGAPDTGALGTSGKGGADNGEGAGSGNAGAGTAGTSGGPSGSTAGTGGSHAGAGAGSSGSGGSSAGPGGATAGASGGAAGAGGSQAGAGAGGSGGDSNRTFVNLAVALGMPLDKNGGAMAPSTTPPGWVWYPIDGSQCRDGSGSGFFVRYGSVNKLVIYMEGGGACDSAGSALGEIGFCAHNPKNVMEYFSTITPGVAGGETILASLSIATDGQVPQKTGIFDTTHMDNPFLNWSQIYIPYCTGDVHFGSKTNVIVDADMTLGPQQFVGHLNMTKFIARIVPTFQTVDRVILTGASAGGFGAGLNYGMVQDTFGSVPVDLIDDSGPPFLGNDAVAPCLQKRWRDLWGMTDSLPSDCTECNNADGTGLTNIVDYWQAKYHGAHVGLVSSVHDEVIRLFYGAGYMNCMQMDPVGLYGNPGIDMAYPGDTYQQNLLDLRTQKASTGQFATYYIGAPNDLNHQHIWRDRFYQAVGGTSGPTIAAWTTDFLSGKMTQVGP